MIELVLILAVVMLSGFGVCIWFIWCELIEGLGE
jgi:hypothetical protein